MVPTAGSKLITSQLEHTPKVPGMRRLITLTSQQTSEVCRCPHFPASDSGCHVAGQVAVTPRFVFVPQALGQLLQVQPLAVASTPLGLFLVQDPGCLGKSFEPCLPSQSKASGGGFAVPRNRPKSIPVQSSQGQLLCGCCAVGSRWAPRCSVTAVCHMSAHFLPRSTIM